MAGALSHLKVLDLTRVLAGPWASQLLADLGADVIKVERPGLGDDTRHWGPPYLKGADGEATGESAYYQCANRGKRSICVDLTMAEGQATVRKLARQSDIMLENHKTGGLAKFGLDYASLEALNPRLVYCSITGFGQTGPYADRPGYDFLVQAMGGLMSITGEPDERPGGGPKKVGVALTDILTGLYATTAILAAITERERSGRGQYIDLALLDVTAASLANQATNYLVGGRVPGRMGSEHPSIVPYQAFATADGQCIVAVGNDEQFRRYAKLLGRPEWGADERFSSNAARVAQRETLIPLLAEVMRGETTEHWLALCEAGGVPAAPINRIDQVFDDPQILARDMKIEMEHALGTKVVLPGNPIKLSRTPVEYRRAPPLLGQHTEEVLAELEESGD